MTLLFGLASAIDKLTPKYSEASKQALIANPLFPFLRPASQAILRAG